MLKSVPRRSDDSQSLAQVVIGHCNQLRIVISSSTHVIFYFYWHANDQRKECDIRSGLNKRVKLTRSLLLLYKIYYQN